MPGNPFFQAAPFAFCFVGLDLVRMLRQIGTVHRSTASGLETGEMLVLEGLHESTMCYPLLF